MIKVKVNQSDVDALLKEVKNFGNQIVQNTAPALDKAGNITYGMIRSNIGTHSPWSVTEVYGETWSPLSKNWILEKERKRATMQIWAETGEIEAAVRKDISASIVFVGISESDSPDAYAHSIANEFGYKRPLFTAVGNKIKADIDKGSGEINDLLKNIIIKAAKDTWGQ